MERRITLVRHGRSAHVHTAHWIDAAGLARWRDAYELAGIDPADAPPAVLVAEAARAGVVVASEAPRAIASAERLVAAASGTAGTPGARAVTVSPLLRETDLRVPRWVGWRMPLTGWALAIGVDWLLGAAEGGRTTRATHERAVRAAEWLAGLAAAHGSVLVVTHAAFRRLLAARLVSVGWQPQGSRRSLRHWSAWRLIAVPDGDGLASGVRSA
jgi:broad specificity phosphatase PhoE